MKNLIIILILLFCIPVLSISEVPESKQKTTVVKKKPAKKDKKTVKMKPRPVQCF
jgi:hypothetical protein